MASRYGMQQPLIIPEDHDREDIRPKSLISFISYVQKFYNIENYLVKQGKKLPPYAFTIKDNLWVLGISFTTTLVIELLFFTFFFFPLFIILKSGVWQPFPISGYIYSIVVYGFTFLTLIINTGIYIYLSRYYLPESVVVKKALQSLFMGRVTALIFKAIIFFLIALIIGSFIYDPRGCKLIAEFLSGLPLFKNYSVEYLYNKIMQTENVAYIETYIATGIFLLTAGLTYLPLIYKELLHRTSRIFKYDRDVFKKNATHVGWGFELDPNKDFKIKPLYLSEKTTNVHTGILGTTGTGKTKLLTYFVEQDIRKGHAVVIIDPKNDGELLDKVVQVALEEGRIRDLIFISPLYPEFSATVNPLAYYYMPEEIVNHIISGVKSREEYFINIAKGVSLGVVSALRILHKNNPDFKFNFATIMKYTSREGLERLAEMLEVLKNQLPPEEKHDAEITLNNIKTILEYPPDFFSKVASGLSIVLAILTSENIGKIIGNIGENHFVRMIEEGRRPIVVVQTASMMVNQTSGIVGKVILSMIQSLCGRFAARKEKFKYPLKLHIDEAYTMFYDGIENLYDKGRGVGLHIFTYFQSIAQVYASVGKDKGNAILDNINNWICFRVLKFSANYISDLIGTVDKYNLIFNSSNDYTVTTVRAPLVEPEMLTNLPDRTFVMFKRPEDNNIYQISTNTFLGKVPFIPEPYINVKLPKMKIPGIEEKIA
jgi:type IV secretory pathway TraG/TraD family ATPase VirD4